MNNIDFASLPDIPPIVAVIAMTMSILFDLTITSTIIFMFRLHLAYKNGVKDASESRYTPSGFGWLNDHYNHVFRWNYNVGIKRGIKLRPKVEARYAVADERAMNGFLAQAPNQSKVSSYRSI